MKIEDVEKPLGKRIEHTILNNKDEFFDCVELVNRVGTEKSDKTVRYHCEKLVKEGKIEDLKIGNKKVYGSEEAIKALKSKLGYE